MITVLFNFYEVDTPYLNMQAIFNFPFYNLMKQLSLDGYVHKNTSWECNLCLMFPNLLIEKSMILDKQVETSSNLSNLSEFNFTTTSPCKKSCKVYLIKNGK